MSTEIKSPITVSALINAPIEKVWELWTLPEHIVNWNHATDEWHTPNAKNDLNVGGRFIYRMEAKDGSFGFDFEGTYESIEINKQIVYKLDDGRSVNITFLKEGEQTSVSETFDPETENPIEMQRDGWQAILNKFKSYAESTQKI